MPLRMQMRAPWSLGVCFLAACAAGLRVQQTSDNSTAETEPLASRTMTETHVLWEGLRKHISALEAAQRVAKTAGETAKGSPVEIDIMRSLRPCAGCQQPKRYGQEHDGGYVMCTELLDGNKTKAGYSIGVNGEDSWGGDVSRQFSVPIYQFDCTNSVRPSCPDCDFHFYDLCVAAKSDDSSEKKSYKTLEELMALNGHGGRGETNDLVLKIDVEGFEWNLFRESGVANTLKEFSQIAVEFHGLLPDAEDRARERLKALTHLNEFFVVAHLHGNNCCQPMQTYEDPSAPGKTYSIPRVLEVLYVKRGLGLDHQCESEPERLPIDSRNIAWKGELPPPRLPE